MTRNTVMILGAAAAAVVAYAVSRALAKTSVRAMEATNDRQVTEASEDSFPASDAPSNTPLTGSVIGNR